ncbi:MAG: SUMF1/EgtB/PvdO family nonheme iron enzyme [Flavobacteriales bacterium]|nr:SUMF1/EgtB/PvdO family nonheme iron enzyme [Flavobacteriales bacterium]
MDKNYDRIDELFNSARKEDPRVSFDETKAQFLTVTSNSNAPAFSKTSKTILGIAVLAALWVGYITYQNYNSDEASLETIPAAKEIIAPLAEVKFDNIIVDDDTKIEESTAATTPPEEKKRAVYAIKAVVPAVATTEPKVNIEPSMSSKPKEATSTPNVLAASYRLPVLTPEERMANNKRKVRMLKLIAKNKHFSYIPKRKMSDLDAESVKAFWMQQSEVTNLEYRTFLFDLLIKGKKEEFWAAKPDQEMWVKEYPKGYNQPMVDKYFSHESYNNYPVVAVSRKGAEMYCDWLTNELKLHTTSSTTMRLPTSEEWKYAANGLTAGNKFPTPTNSLTNNEGQYLANYHSGTKWEEEGELDGYMYPASVRSYNPNDYGIFDLAGNLAEMVYYESEDMLPGTKGGSFTSSVEELEIDGPDRFKGVTTASVNIGFRPVRGYIEEKKTPSRNDAPISLTDYIQSNARCLNDIPNDVDMLYMDVTITNKGELLNVQLNSLNEFITIVR